MKEFPLTVKVKKTKKGSHYIVLPRSNVINILEIEEGDLLDLRILEIIRKKEAESE